MNRVVVFVHTIVHANKCLQEPVALVERDEIKLMGIVIRISARPPAVTSEIYHYR